LEENQSESKAGQELMVDRSRVVEGKMWENDGFRASFVRWGRVGEREV
jgi:hypothetical protein